MELDLGPEIAQFRAELRDWIAAEAPRSAGRPDRLEHALDRGWPARRPAGRGGGPPGLRRMGGQDGGQEADLPAVADVESAARAWTRSRYAVFNEELHRAGVPRGARGMGESLVGPADHRARHATSSARTSCRASSPARTCTARGTPSPATARTWPESRRAAWSTGTRSSSPARRSGRRARTTRQPDVPAVPDGPRRGKARRALLRADRLHRPRRAVPAGQADVGCGGILRRLPRRCAGPAVQRHRRPQQRLAGGDDDARVRARRAGHGLTSASSGSSGSWSRRRASAGRPPIRWSGSGSPGATPRSS